jgi:hypothetical protein
VYEAIGQPEQGIVPAKRALTLYQSLRDPSREAVTWALLVSLYRATGQELEGEEARQRALSIHRHQHFAVHAVH